MKPIIVPLVISTLIGAVCLADWVLVDTVKNQIVTVVREDKPAGDPGEGLQYFRHKDLPAGVTNAPAKPDTTTYRDPQSKIDLKVETLEERVRNLQLAVYVLAGIQNGTITNGERVKFVDAGGETQSMRSNNLLNLLVRWLRKTVTDWAP